MVRRFVKPRLRSAPLVRHTTPRGTPPRRDGVAAADEGSEVGRPRSSTLSPIPYRPDDDPEVPLDGCGELASRFRLFTAFPEAVRPLLGPGLDERLLANWKPYLELEGLGDRLVVTRRSWIEPKDVRTMLDQAAWILDDLMRASPR